VQSTDSFTNVLQAQEAFQKLGPARNCVFGSDMNRNDRRDRKVPLPPKWFDPWNVLHPIDKVGFSLEQMKLSSVFSSLFAIGIRFHLLIVRVLINLGFLSLPSTFFPRIYRQYVLTKDANLRSAWALGNNLIASLSLSR
jgi:hypothetical protein